MNNSKIRALDITALQTFAALMEERNVSRAARRLGLTQSAASHALRRLRDVFDDPLFARAPDGMAPTAKALQLAPGVANALRELTMLVEPQGRFDPARARRCFVIGMSDYAISVYLPGLLRAHPATPEGVTFRIRHTSRAIGFDMLRRGEIELAVGNFAEAPGDLRKEDIAWHDFVCAAAPGHPFFAAKRLRLRNYLDAEHLHVSLAGESHGLVDAALARDGRRRRVVATVPHFLVVGGLLAASPLIATEPRAVIAPLARAYGLAVREAPFPVDAFSFSTIWRRQSDTDPAIDWLRTEIRKISARATGRKASSST